MTRKIILITGGSGFIGSALIRHLIQNTNHKVINIDVLTYASNVESLESIELDKNYKFIQADICDSDEIFSILNDYHPDIIMHLAAESHVDRSIDGPSEFIKTNIYGTYNLLEQSRSYFSSLKESKKSSFRFHHISTDEVYGDLKNSTNLFTEESSYKPSSPYAASKASSDHLVRAWYRTFNLPILITNCSNNYGPFQFPEKLIPLLILRALEGKSLPIYGDGLQIRDWIFVDDHVKALMNVALNGEIGETYNIGGNNEISNIDVVKKVCSILDELIPNKKDNFNQYSDLISYVDDRPGHDQRYAVNANKIQKELGWVPLESFETGIRKTIKWYLENQIWCKKITKSNLDVKRIGVIKS